MCQPSEPTLNISAAIKLVLDLTGGWNKIFGILFLLQGCHAKTYANQLTKHQIFQLVQSWLHM